MKRLFLVIFVGLLLLLSPQCVFADTNFSTAFDVNYSVNENGITHVVFTGSLTNKNANNYAASYAIDSGFSDVQNLLAYDDGGKITPIVTDSGNGKSIKLNFIKQSTGLGSILHFTFSFDTPNIAKKVGSIWEVNIPGIARQTDFDNFTVHVVTPYSFGKPTYIKPAHDSNDLTFSKDDLGTGGISIAFGSSQTYAFTLNYHIANNNIFPVTTEIALPPTTNYQDVSITNISPRPNNVVLDIDGNWLAQYKMMPGEKELVSVTGFANVSLVPTKQPLTTEERNIDLSSQPFWQVDDQSIKQLASELKTPQEIYNYVVGHLHYDFSRVAGQQQRLGATAVLENPTSAVCLEFTDLFIALSRAAGIPAREVDGFAYTQNDQERPVALLKDILHAWPEYYDDTKGTWVMVDPTWGNTTKGIDYFNTLDFDHVAFVVKGKNSEYPVPAGGYKLKGDENIKDVFVSISQAVNIQDPRIQLGLDAPSLVLAGLPITTTLSLTNTGQRLFPSQQLIIETKELNPHLQNITIAAIPPFGKTTTSINFEKTSVLTNTQAVLTIQLAGNTLTKQIRVYPFFLQKNIVIGGIIIALFCIILSFIAAKTWRIPVPR